LLVHDASMISNSNGKNLTLRNLFNISLTKEGR
jgi:transposase